MPIVPSPSLNTHKDSRLIRMFVSSFSSTKQKQKQIARRVSTNISNSCYKPLSLSILRLPAQHCYVNPLMLLPLTKYLKSNKRTLSLLEQPCLTMRQIKQIQTQLIVSGSISDPFAAGKIIAFCAISQHGDLEYAHRLLSHLPKHTTFIWNTMIRGFVEKKQPIEATSIHQQMLHHGLYPNNYTFSFVLRASTDLTHVFLGREFHSQIVRLGWESYDFVQNGLIHMYANCDCVSCARKLFDESSNLDVISWTAMVNGYAKTGQVEVARGLFDRMPERNSVSWSAMITGYAQFGMFNEALELFNEMQLHGVKPNHAGIVGALSACGCLGALDQGRWIHGYVDKNRFKLDKVLRSALIDMYARCGCIETASQVFNEMEERDVFAFTSMISGLANHGQSASAIELFYKMREEGVKPNEVTFICVLSACSRMGLVEEAQRIFKSMYEVYGIDPAIQHYGCLVDLLGHAGLIEEAKKVVHEMPMEPDSYVLGALLSACRMHGNIDIGKEMVENFVERGLDHSGVHVLLSNMYASANQWEDVAKVRKEIKDKFVTKVPGCSAIEVDGVFHEFVSGYRSHAFMEEILSSLIFTNKQLKSLVLDDDFNMEEISS